MAKTYDLGGVTEALIFNEQMFVFFTFISCF